MPAPITNDLFATTAPGLESIALGELKRLGLKGKAEVGGVSYRGDQETIFATNLWLRTASRVLVRLAQFHASTFHELERRANRVPWAEFVPVNGTVRVRVTCRKSRLYHSDAVAERILGAIARVAPGTVQVESESSAADDADQELETANDARTPAQLFVVRIVDDQCEISADTSGELLHRRGYRQEIGKAPLRETLAAAILLASGWRPSESLMDPLCGSGTIPIEAALLARGIAPGLTRRFAFMEWQMFEKERWEKVLGQARDAAVTNRVALEISGADRDKGAIEAATRNAKRAGVADDIRFVVRTLSVVIGHELVDETIWGYFNNSICNSLGKLVIMRGEQHRSWKIF